MSRFRSGVEGDAKLEVGCLLSQRVDADWLGEPPVFTVSLVHVDEPIKSSPATQSAGLSSGHGGRLALAAGWISCDCELPRT
jgi:hypothetical protein